MVQQQRKRLPRSSAVAEKPHDASCRVIEYFAKSLKVSRNDTLEYGVCKLKVFRSAGRGDLVRHRQSTVDCHAEVSRSVDDMELLTITPIFVVCRHQQIERSATVMHRRVNMLYDVKAGQQIAQTSTVWVVGVMHVNVEVVSDRHWARRSLGTCHMAICTCD